jgi:SET domain-containing protein
MHRSAKISVEERPEGGRGLFARAPIARGEILIDFRGAPVVARPTRTSLHIDDDRHLAGLDETNAFLNHSCEPTAGYDYAGVYLRALGDIAPGEEITVNYNAGDDDLAEKFRCDCGSPSCIGEIRGFRHLSRAQQLRLRPLLAPYLRRRLEEEKG